MTLIQLVTLALVQGLSEFLPVSSSGHLILIPHVMGWPDQGVVMDVMVHVGSLLAVLVYFHRDVARMLIGVGHLIRRRPTDEARLTFHILIATIPAVIVGFALKETGLIDRVRSVELVAIDLILFGVLLWIADIYGANRRQVKGMGARHALLIGCAQAVALFPGVSRSGVTTTMARALGYERQDAVRFSFLISIPAITGAGLLTALDILDGSAAGVSLSDAAVAGGFAFLSALAAIAFMMRYIRTGSFLPFTIYRILLGLILLMVVA